MVQRRPLFIPFRLRCLLAFAWLAHKTFPGSPMPKIVPPFIRCRIQRVILAFSWAAERTFMGSPMRMRVDVPKIVPPFEVLFGPSREVGGFL